MTVPKLATVLGVAEVALDIAKEHAAQQRASAIRSLSTQLALLALALLLGVGMMLMVSRRVTRPLSVIQDGMHRLAGGDIDGRGAVRRPQGRDRRACRRDAGVQGQPRRSGPPAQRAARNRGARREAAQGRDAPARRRIPDHGRQYRQRGLDRVRRAREGRRHADAHRRKHAAALRRGRVRVGGSLHQRADGRERGRRDDRVGQRDRAPGAGVEHDRGRSGEAGRQDRRAHRASSRRRRAASATW